MVKQGTVIAVAVTGLLLYLFHPSYQSGVEVAGFLPNSFWLVIPVAVGLVIWYASSNSSQLKRLLGMMQQQEKQLENPLVVLEKFENSMDRLLVQPYEINQQGMILMGKSWVFPCTVDGKKNYLILNAVKGANLLPMMVSPYDLHSIGYESVLDFKRSSKSRTAVELIKAGMKVSDIEDVLSADDSGDQL